jgi:hypothetical protein
VTENNQTTKPVKSHWWWDAIVSAVFALLLVLSLALPVLLPLCIGMVSALYAGKRREMAILYAFLAAYGAFIFYGSWVPTLCAFIALLAVPFCQNYWHEKAETKSHMDGIVVSCAAMVVVLAAAYGIAAVALSGNPIAQLAGRLHEFLAGADTPLSSALLQALWQLDRMLGLTVTAVPLDIRAFLDLAVQSQELSHAQLALQTQTTMVEFFRSIAVYVVLIWSILGGLVAYVIPARILAAPRDKGVGKWMRIKSNRRRQLPSFRLWMLPQDISNSLFFAMVITFLLSFFDVPFMVVVQSIVYSIFSMVFFMQGLCFASYFLVRWKVPAAVRILLYVSLALPLSGLLTMMGIIDQVFKIRLVMERGPMIQRLMNMMPRDNLPKRIDEELKRIEEARKRGEEQEKDQGRDDDDTPGSPAGGEEPDAPDENEDKNGHEGGAQR